MTSAPQKDAFLGGEADQWFRRNRGAIDGKATDVVTRAVEALDLRPTAVLEIGAANGYRLDAFRESYGCRTAGVEPSAEAVEDGRTRFPAVDLRQGAADSLPFEDASFDLVVFGFCLYLVDPVLHFRAVAEADRVLKDGGTLAIFDFLADQPYYNDYAHLPGLRAHKMEFSRLFLAHPGYTLVRRELDRKSDDFLSPDRREAVDVLVKNLAGAFPPNPNKR